jgi:Kef-type K+ transport system membrane component KefB
MDPVSHLGLSIALILVAAKLGGDLAVRLGQPPVTGELLAGTVLGNSGLSSLQSLRTDPTLDTLARLGVLILLFEVGLESTIRDVLRVGLASARVAVLGTAGTLALAWAVAAMALPAAGTLAHAFVASALTATSVGISARVLRDAGVGRSEEAHTILGAAFLDDILGLIALAVVTAAAAHSAEGTAITVRTVAWLVLQACVFLALAIAAGVLLSPALFRLAARLRATGSLLAAGLSFCFVLAWASNALGLSPIVGAFAAGLILEESHSARFVDRGEASLATRIEPISSWLVPIFFVLMGMRSDLGVFRHGATLLLGALLAVAAVAGKLVCAFGAPARSDRIAIALGMIPRGEVSLVFVNVGLSTRVIDAPQGAALVAVVIVTTLVAPAALRSRLRSSGVAR